MFYLCQVLGCSCCQCWHLSLQSLKLSWLKPISVDVWFILSCQVLMFDFSHEEHWHPWLFNKHGFKMIITWFIILLFSKHIPSTKTNIHLKPLTPPCHAGNPFTHKVPLNWWEPSRAEAPARDGHWLQPPRGLPGLPHPRHARGQRQRRESNRPTGGTRRGNGQHGASTTLCGCSGQNLCAKCDDLGCVDCIGILEGCVFLLWFLKREVCRVTCLEVYLLKGGRLI